MVEGSMTQGAGQGPVESTQGMTTGWGYEPTLRDTRLAPEDHPAPVGPPAGHAENSPEGYPPTEHDLPVITMPPPPPAPAPENTPAPSGPLYVVGDVHGYLDQLRT